MEQLRILFDQIGSETVAGDEIEVAFLQQVIFNSAQDCDVVAFTDFRHQYANRKAALGAKTARKKIWTVVEFSRCSENRFLGFGCDRIGNR